MKQRCLNKKHKWYHYYGGRGITVCEKWMTFIGFLEDMGERPVGLTLERNEVNEGYCKANCIWADIRSQNRNRRRGLSRTNIEL